MTLARNNRIADRLSARYQASAIDLKPLFGLIAQELGLDPGLSAQIAALWNAAMSQGRWAATTAPELSLVGAVEHISVAGVPVLRAYSMAQYLLDMEKLLAPLYRTAAALPDPPAEVASRIAKAFDDTQVRRQSSILGRWLYFDAESTKRFSDPNFIYAHWLKPLTYAPQLRVPGYAVQRFSTRVGNGSGGFTSSLYMSTDFDLSQERGTRPVMVRHLPPED